MLSTSQLLDSLNESQRKAVTHVEGPLLTLAGPGSGKTRVVTHRIAYLIDQGVSPYSILALTFTNKAAREMKHRIAKMVDDAPVWMGTFHGYCVRFLRRFGQCVGLSANFSIFDTDDAHSAFKKALDLANVSTTHLNIGDLERRVSALKNKAISAEAFEAMAQGANDKIIAKVYPAYQKILLQNNAVDFDDLLMHTACILRSNNDLRADLDDKHRFVLVDEYQDTNVAQYLIVRGLSLDYPNINVTGDPDQSIYSWRGADISNILNFERDYPNVVTVRLEQNYRSTPQILSIADSLISCNTRRKEKVLRPTRERGASVRYCTYLTDRDEADDIAQRIALEILENGAKAKDFAVLYRTNAQSRLLEQALLRRKLNYQLIGGFRFYQREEIKDILAYLRLIHNPTDDVSFERIVNVPTRGLGDKSLSKVAELAKMREVPMLVALRASIASRVLSNKAEAGAKQFLALYEQLVSKSGGRLLDLIDFLLAESKYLTYITNRKSETPDESIVGNINELRADAAQIDNEEETAGNAIERFLEQVTLSSDVDNINDVDNRVTLMTLHAAKGLEFDNVFVIAIEDGVLPHIRSRDNPIQLEEERRLFFVGITRAKNRLQLSMAKKRGFLNHRMGVPSQFLMELPRAELEKVDMSELHYFDTEFSPEEDEGFGDFAEEDFEEKSAKNPKTKPPNKSFLHDAPGKRSKGAKPKGPIPGESEDLEQAIPGTSAATGRKKTILYSSEEENGKDGDVPTTNLGQNDFGDVELDQETTSKLKLLQEKLPALGLRTGATLQNVTTKEGVGVDLFEVGSVVRHPEYGIGQIESIDGRGHRRMARVSFENGKEASFQLNKSSLHLIEA